MFERLRRGVVQSYVGAIALGWLLADAVMHFAGIFAAPVASWISRREFHEMPGPPHPNFSTDFLMLDALPELIRTVAIVVAWLLLFYWLYLRPVNDKEGDSIPGAEVGK